MHSAAAYYTHAFHTESSSGRASLEHDLGGHAVLRAPAEKKKEGHTQQSQCTATEANLIFITVLVEREYSIPKPT